jgi:hypothetical protein
MCVLPPIIRALNNHAQMMEAVLTSETSVNFNVTTWRSIPENSLNFILTAVRTFNLKI